MTPGTIILVVLCFLIVLWALEIRFKQTRDAFIEVKNIMKEITFKSSDKVLHERFERLEKVIRILAQFELSKEAHKEV